MAIKKGIYAASMSIFNQDLSLDVDFTIKHSEKLIQSGLHGAIFFVLSEILNLIFACSISLLLKTILD